MAGGCGQDGSWLSVAMIDLRASGESELWPFVQQAVNWNPDRAPVSLQAIASDPALSVYGEGFPRGEDVGFGWEEEGRLVGAAWARFGMEAYGYVAADIPELILAVEEDFRGRGLGTTLLTALLARLSEGGVEAVSLSVEDGNTAVGLYDAFGFAAVGRHGDSDVMLLKL